MKERPILFSGEMVRAILAGRKTQTRRVIKGDPELTENGGFSYADRKGNRWLCGMGTDRAGTIRNFMKSWPCPYGQPGDRLWVRETHMIEDYYADGKQVVLYRADYEDKILGKGWKPSIHMPRWASRITLEITGVRVERLNDISEQDAAAEGVEKAFGSSYKHYLDDKKDCGYATASFSSLWESINGAGSWQQNPWCWVIEFKKI